MSDNSKSPIPSTSDANVAGCGCAAKTYAAAKAAESPCGPGFKFDPATGQCVPQIGQAPAANVAGRRQR
jgi:hypothetical protein